MPLSCSGLQVQCAELHLLTHASLEASAGCQLVSQLLHIISFFPYSQLGCVFLRSYVAFLAKSLLQQRRLWFAFSSSQPTHQSMESRSVRGYVTSFRYTSSSIQPVLAPNMDNCPNSTIKTYVPLNERLGVRGLEKETTVDEGKTTADSHSVTDTDQPQEVSQTNWAENRRIMSLLSLY